MNGMATEKKSFYKNMDGGLNEQMNLKCIIVFILAILLSGCVTSYNTTETVEPIIEDYEIPDIPQTPLPTPTPTPKFEPVEILLNDVIKNNVANKSHYTMVGGAKDVHVCGNMACEQAEWIKDNYGYETGVVILWAKHQEIGHGQTWVVIDDERYVFESTNDAFWTEYNHNEQFSESYKICFVSTKKGREYTKESAEFCRTG